MTRRSKRPNLLEWLRGRIDKAQRTAAARGLSSDVLAQELAGALKTPDTLARLKAANPNERQRAAEYLQQVVDEMQGRDILPPDHAQLVADAQATDPTAETIGPLLTWSAAGVASAGDEALRVTWGDETAPPQDELAAKIASGFAQDRLAEVGRRIEVLRGFRNVRVTGWAFGGLVMWREDGDERGEWHEPAHELLADAEAAGVPNPLAPLAEAWRNLPVESGLDSQPYAVVPNAAYRKAMQAEFPNMPVPVLAANAIEHKAGYLPGLEPTAGPEPAWPLVLFDAAGLESMTQGRGIAIPLRLGLEAMMQAPPSVRTHGVLVTVHLRDVVDWIWPNGWRPRVDRAKLAEAAEAVGRLVLPGEWIINGMTFRRWRPVTIRADAFDSLDAGVLLDVRLPQGSGQGPMIDRAQLRAYGVDSAPAYRGYLSAAYHWNEHGTRFGRRILPVRSRVKRNAADLIVDQAGNVILERGKPTRNTNHPRAVQLGGFEDNPAAEKYGLLRVFTPDDLAQLIHGKAKWDGIKNQREYRRRAVEVYERMAEDGAIMLPPGRTADGADGWQVLPPDGFGPD